MCKRKLLVSSHFCFLHPPSPTTNDQNLPPHSSRLHSPRHEQPYDDINKSIFLLFSPFSFRHMRFGDTVGSEAAAAAVFHAKLLNFLENNSQMHGSRLICKTSAQEKNWRTACEASRRDKSHTVETNLRHSDGRRLRLGWG